MGLPHFEITSIIKQQVKKQDISSMVSNEEKWVKKQNIQLGQYGPGDKYISHGRLYTV
jgi:hypothetical protein